MGGEAAVRRDKVWGRVMWGENERRAVRERWERAVRPACVFAFSDHESKAKTEVKFGVAMATLDRMGPERRRHGPGPASKPPPTRRPPARSSLKGGVAPSGVESATHGTAGARAMAGPTVMAKMGMATAPSS